MPDPYVEQIELDIRRTFTEDEGFNNNKDHHSKLLNILLAYAKRNTSVGYCQGMNYLGGMIVRVVENEEEAFWVFTSLFENILPLDYFCLMTEILVDQKVFLHILQKKKAKLYKHLQNIGLDFAIISFQWLVCLLSANLEKCISETIWDFLFLEGSVTIFRAILAILSILEADLLQQTEFNELYTILDTNPKEVIKDPEMFIKHMSKFTGIKQKHIDKMRDRFRPIIMEEQKYVWLDNSRSGCPNPTDTPIFKRVKLLNKFFLLNRAMRRYKNDAVVDLDEANLQLSNKIKCSMHWPICLYDFTVRTRITNYFVFKVAKPVKVISDYFGAEQDPAYDGGIEDVSYVLVPSANKEITIYDSTEEKKRKRMESGHNYESQSSENSEEIIELDDNQLLMSREAHSCVYKGFEKHFQKLFDQESEILFQNWTIHGSYGGELESALCFDQFVREILSSKEIDKIKNSDEPAMRIERRLLELQDHRHQSFRLPRSQLTQIREELRSSFYQQSQESMKSGEEGQNRNPKAFGSVLLPE